MSASDQTDKYAEYMAKLRERGKLLPRRLLKDHYTLWQRGYCEINEKTEIYTRRASTVAKFSHGDGVHDGQYLYDACTLWRNKKGRFVITGIERIKDGEDIVEFAQSWLVRPFTIHLKCRKADREMCQRGHGSPYIRADYSSQICTTR